MDQTLSICSSCGQVNRVSVDSRREPICGKCKQALPFHDGVTDLQTTSSLKTLSEKSSLPIIVDFWAPWCGPCRAFASIYKEAATALAGRAVLTKINTEASPMAGDYFQIRSIPTLAIFQNGVEKARISGALPLPQFIQWVEQAAKS